MFGFGKEKFGASKPAAVERETATTDPAAIEALQDKIRSIVQDLPNAEGLSSDLNIAMTANFLRREREKEGKPYSAEEIEALDEDFAEEVKAVFLKRVEAQGEAPAYRVVNRDGFVVGETGSVVQAGEIAAREREHEDRV